MWWPTYLPPRQQVAKPGLPLDAVELTQLQQHACRWQQLHASVWSIADRHMRILQGLNLNMHQTGQ
jgi:hypothetical protein